ncbi:hypothetical protein AALO_G00071330 [Alosa alosa]|uniref:Uncharacterized protein n=1 Tax=Alosa alosa TaxID=278164 RepID=A0AAV6H5U1_9TELE|nr:hypothetical protein AALO_G00071330 [Alosa alosa]
MEYYALWISYVIVAVSKQQKSSSKCVEDAKAYRAGLGPQENVRCFEKLQFIGSADPYELGEGDEVPSSTTRGPLPLITSGIILLSPWFFNNFWKSIPTPDVFLSLTYRYNLKHGNN